MRENHSSTNMEVSINMKCCLSNYLPRLWKHCFLAMFPEGGQTRKHCFLAMFPEGGQTRKHCFLAMFPQGGQTRKHCFLAMFLEGGQTKKHCFLAIFLEGGQTRKHCFLAMFLEGGQTRKHCFLAMSFEGGQTRKHCFLAMFPEGEQTSKYHTSRKKWNLSKNICFILPLGRKFSFDNNVPKRRNIRGNIGIFNVSQQCLSFPENRRSSYDDSDIDGRRSPLFVAEFQERAQFPKRSPILDRRSKILYDETTKVTGKPPLSPKTVKSLPSTPYRQPQQHFNFNTRRNSAAMVLEQSQRTVPGRSGTSSVNGSIENLAMELGDLEISLYYSSEERLLKVCVVNIHSPE